MKTNHQLAIATALLGHSTLNPALPTQVIHSRSERRPGSTALRGFIARTLLVSLFIGLLLGHAPRSLAAGATIAGQLANFDVRYPSSLPNDFETFLCGDGLKTNDVKETWNSNNLLGGNGVQWGTASSITPSVNNDPNSPAYGLDCLTVRWAGPPRPAMVGNMVHFGVRSRIGTAVVHQELWWTINGQRIQRNYEPQVFWSCSTNGWLICVANPTTTPIYIYGARYFRVPTNSPLPLLSQLNTSINPAQFGAANWTPLAPPSGVVFGLPPWGRTYFRVPSTNCQPVVFQIASRDVSDSVLPLPPATTGPNPNDFNGQNGTMIILTTRPTQEFAEDMTNDGVVGIPDFNQLRSRFGTVSQDQP